MIVALSQLFCNLNSANQISAISHRRCLCM